MVKKQSAGILLYRRLPENTEVFLVHPGGPFWKNKNAGAWSIPKGEFTNEEDAFTAACREFKEEIGYEPKGNFIQLIPIHQKSGKKVHAWACEGNLNESNIISNPVTMIWPPKSNSTITFPEVDKGNWFTFLEASEKVIPAQISLLIQLENYLKILL